MSLGPERQCAFDASYALWARSRATSAATRCATCTGLRMTSPALTRKTE